MSETAPEGLRSEYRRLYVEMSSMFLQGDRKRLRDCILEFNNLNDKWFEHEWEEAHKEDM